MASVIQRVRSLSVGAVSGGARVAALAVLLLGGATSVLAAPIVVDPNPTPCVVTTAHYTTIQSAVSAAPSGATIQVCPGTYAEQVTIATPLTLKGVTNTAANTGAAVVTIPGGTFTSGFTQIDIQAAGVTLVNIGVDGSNTVSGCTSGTLIGILFDSGSSGSLKQVALRNHNISDGSGGYCTISASSGIGVSSTSATSVTITDSSIRNYAGTGIQVTTTSDVTIKATAVTPVISESNCVYVSAPTVTVSGNTMANCVYGVRAASTVLGTVSGNTISGAGFGISGAGVFCGFNCTAFTVSGNQISDTFNGVTMKTSGGVGGVVFQNNDISGTVNAVYLFLQPGNTVSNNTITDATTGVFGASGNTLSGNVYRTVTNLTQ